MIMKIISQSKLKVKVKKLAINYKFIHIDTYIQLTIIVKSIYLPFWMINYRFEKI